MAKPVTNKMILGAGLICLIGVSFIAFAPIIPEPKQCITTPCDQFITILDAVQKLDFSETSTLTPLAPDGMVDEPSACIEIFDPVCDFINNVQYPNQCFAILEDVNPNHLVKGEC